ncbi:MAG TPA: hypothetical protein VLT34_12630 [Arthrobacter sp.]|nr:hypothetical protein [Arthrobacter sp.]
MKAVVDRLPRWALITCRALAVLTLPIAVIAAVAAVSAFAFSWGLDRDLFYMRTEATLISFIPLFFVVIISLFLRWFGSRKVAFRLMGFSLAALVLFVGTAATFETINTRPIVAAASTFEVPAGLIRQLGTNGDGFSAAPGFVPCVDIMGQGCPNVRRTWDAPADKELTAAYLQDVLEDSGWTKVKIQPGECDLRDSENGRYPSCLAEGPLGSYKATVQMVKINNWELRMYLRPAGNVR